jgi:uncharacterized membrane protein YphA (DoxX/SURF4 family)
MPNREAVMVEEPRIARLLFADTRFAWLWLPLRLYLGWAWWEAGWHKFVDPKWIDGPGTSRVLAERPQNDIEAGDRFRLVSIVH